MPSKVLFFHNYPLLSQHINFEKCAEQPQRMNIVKQAMLHCQSNGWIIPQEVSLADSNAQKHLDVLQAIHPLEHIYSVNQSTKSNHAIYPVQMLTSTLKQVFQQNITYAFYAVRPPGHHSFQGGANKDDNIDQADSVGEGFCFYNNVAIAVDYIAKSFSKKSILIIDWDYHHGNGTQHAFFKFDENDHNLFDARHINYDTYFLSLHNATIYPYEEYPLSLPNNFGTLKGKARNANSFIDNIHIAKNDFQDAIYLDIFEKSIDRVFRYFTPDTIIISAGFDARTGDPVARFETNQGLTDRCYYAITRIVKAKAKNTPIISILEGGYNVDGNGFSQAISAHIEALYND